MLYGTSIRLPTGLLAPHLWVFSQQEQGFTSMARIHSFMTRMDSFISGSSGCVGIRLAESIKLDESSSVGARDSAVGHRRTGI
jgi:hypothetical protein